MNENAIFAKMVEKFDEVHGHDPKFVEGCRMHMRDVLKARSVPYSVSHLEAFLLGMRFAETANATEKDHTVAVLAAFILWEIDQKKKSLAKYKVEEE